MASTAIIPRFLLPRGFSATTLRAFQFHGARNTTVRHASNKSPIQKPLVLEKPDKFRPPSHAARRVLRQPRNYPGPALSQKEKEAQKTKKYPHMFPSEGTFMFWFLTNRGIHLWIACGTLFSLAGIMFITNFKRNTPFADMLPPPRELITSPISFFSQWIDVYKMHTAHVSAEVAERRRRKVDDVQKRSDYRKAHGLEDDENAEGSWKFGWTAQKSRKVDDDVADDASPVAVEGQAADAERGMYTDWDGKKKPVKKWLGIW